jgi:hypothetical protein
VRKHPTKKRNRSLRSDFRSERSKSYSLTLVTDATSLHPVRTRFYCSAVPKKKAKLPLSKTHPKLAKEADGWDPNDFTSGMNQIVAWKCLSGHQWKSSLFRRAEGAGCPVCSNRKILKGVNDFATTHPNLASEVIQGDTTTVSAGSDTKMKWRCSLMHEWVASVGSRVIQKSGCPFCSGTKILQGFNDLETLFPEIAKQADGWDPKKFSAGSHQNMNWQCEFGHKWKSKIQSRVLTSGKRKSSSEANGCPICYGRITLTGFNDLATTHPELASFLLNQKDGTKVSKGSEKKLKWKCSLEHQFEQSPSNIKGELPGCPICHGTKVLPGFNDLKSKFPGIASEMLNLDPSSISSGSSKSVTWRCKLGHEWKARVGSRTNNNSECPYCSGIRILKGFNDLETLYPELSKQIVGADPKSFGRGSKQKVQWKCEKNHLYSASISDRALNMSGCPYCSGNEVLVGFNDLASTHPNVSVQADGWDPHEVTAGSGKKLLWKCEFGHNWITSPQSRALKGTGCPTCSKSGFDPNQNGYLYFIEHDNWIMFQIGITNLPDDRLNDHRKLGWEVLEIRGPMDGHLAQQWETAILRMLKAKGADLSNSKIAGKFDGYSEAWSKSTFQVKSIKELMSLTEEFEEGK